MKTIHLQNLSTAPATIVTDGTFTFIVPVSTVPVVFECESVTINGGIPIVPTTETWAIVGESTVNVVQVWSPTETFLYGFITALPFMALAIYLRIVRRIRAPVSDL